ncbi:hypothetical protein EII10_12325 [Actinomyces bowdenii]|uniref:Uncharacterized protein n=1 Tax=Actinomyces bowdenii TaxID=131109 RepID=A0A3P1UP76_9ACTO|nr:hypothetical protein EII10_12325 [Actinomyces bowdenii]
MNAVVFLRVGLAVMQVALRAGGQGGGADLVGDISTLSDRLKRLQPNRGGRLRAGKHIAAEIAKAVPLHDPEYRDVSENDWESASSDVAALLRALAEEDRWRAGYDWDRLRTTLLEGGGRQRRENLGQASAQAAFDWVLEAACKRVVECLTDSEALRLVLDRLEATGNILSELKDRPVEGQPVDQVIADHNEKLRSLAPERLEGRAEEREELRRFIEDGSESWLAYEARMLSGKTALMATFAKNPPEGVRVVSYFVRKNEAGHGRNDFVFVVMAQLAKMLGDRYVRSPREEEQRTALAYALRLAATSCEHEGKTLVLLIDGLDEDVYFETKIAPGAVSILSVLPRSLPRGVKVVTASRPNPPVPGDVICTDRNVAQVVELASSPHAEASISPEQLREFFGNRMGLPIGSFLAACEGALTARDLCGLLTREGIDVPVDEIESFIGGSSGRLLHPIDVGWEGKPVRAYQLGHEVVLREVLRRLEPDRFGEGEDPEDEQWWAHLRVEALHPYRDLIIEWVWDLVDRSGWSPETPSYALGGGYQSVVQKAMGDPEALELLADRLRNKEILRRYGSAYRSLRAIDEACEPLLIADAPDFSDLMLAALLSVSEERERLSRRSVYVPGLIACNLEYLGATLGATCERVLSIDDAGDRIKAIGEILDCDIPGNRLAEFQSSVMGLIDSVGSQHRDLMSDAQKLRARFFARLGQFEEAARVAGLAEQEARSVDAPGRRAVALANVAQTWAHAGQADEAVRVARSVGESWLCAGALVGVARAWAGQAGEAMRVAGLAEQEARSVAEPWRRAGALVGVARVLAEAGQAGEAARVAGLAEQEARSVDEPWRWARALADVARVLAEAGRVDEAVRVAGLAEQEARSVDEP